LRSIQKLPGPAHEICAENLAVLRIKIAQFAPNK